MSAAPSALAEARRGVLDMTPILVAILPVGALFGTLAVGAGLSPLEAVVMSATMYAGASQMVAVDLWGTAVPVWSIILSVFAVNFRHLLYSAAMTKIVAPFGRATRAAMFFFLVDPAYALAEKRHSEGVRVTRPYYFALSAASFVAWSGSTALGAAFGRLIDDPYAVALDMVLPIYFLSMLLAFRGRARWGRVVVASGVVSTLVYHAPALGIAFLGSPWHISLGALAGILAAALGPMPPRAAPASPRPRFAVLKGLFGRKGAGRTALSDAA